MHLLSASAVQLSTENTARARSVGTPKAARPHPEGEGRQGAGAEVGVPPPSACLVRLLAAAASHAPTPGRKWLLLDSGSMRESREFSRQKAAPREISGEGGIRRWKWELPPLGRGEQGARGGAGQRAGGGPVRGKPEEGRAPPRPPPWTRSWCCCTRCRPACRAAS